ncbi:MAG: hypothetical protein WC755_07660 [Candidatus Woesearchaeota archaeon]|jgi:hypothetical protein
MTILTDEYIISNNSYEVASFVYNQVFLYSSFSKRKKVVMLEKRTDQEVEAISKNYLGTKVNILA